MFGQSKDARPKILLVEDETAILETLKDRLEMNDFIVLTATNGQEGLGATLTGKPALIVTDLRMPVMDGWEMIEELRRRGQDVPVIILSAMKDPITLEHAARLNVAEYLTKPFELSELLGKIQEVLERPLMPTSK